VDVFRDWRSYIAYVLSKIPYVKDRIEYTPLRIGDPGQYYREVLSGVVEDIGKKLEEVEMKERVVEEKEKEYERLIETLKGMEKRWKEEFKKLRKLKDAYDELQKRIEDLRRIMRAADPDELSAVLVQDNMTATTIAAALKGLPDDLKAEMIQAIARRDPKKAADVTALLGSIEEKIEEVKEERESLLKLLDEVAKEKADLIKKDIMVEIVGSYLSNLSSRDVVKMMIDLGLDIDTIAALISSMPMAKAREVLSILQQEHPDVFKGIIERGVTE